MNDEKTMRATFRDTDYYKTLRSQAQDGRGVDEPGGWQDWVNTLEVAQANLFRVIDELKRQIETLKDTK